MSSGEWCDLLIQEPGGGEYQGDVEDHVDHAGPVHGQGAHSVVLLQDVGDDDQLGPLEGVGGGVEDEHGEHGPPDGVDWVDLIRLLSRQLQIQPGGNIEPTGSPDIFTVGSISLL